MKTRLFKYNIPLALLAVILFGSSQTVQAGDGYPSTPAIVQIPKDGQHDTVGFNIVAELPAVLYKRIMEGEITVYKTPLKADTIRAQDFLNKEIESGTAYATVGDLFLDEDWRMQGRKFEFHIRGIYCLNRSSDGVQINYGYIDLEEIKGLMKSYIIPTNCNGPKNLTYWDALYSRRYAFNLLKFGNENFSKEPEKSFQIKNEAFRNPKVTTNAVEVPEVKEVEYIVKRVDFNDDKMNSLLFDAVEGYFEQNPQEFFNLGGAEFVDYTNPKISINLTGIEITETWRRTESGITYQLDRIVFYINDQPLRPISVSELNAMGFLVNFQRMENFLKDKNFYFTIVRINNQKIFGHQAQTVLNHLLTGSWNTILITPGNNSTDN